MIWEEEKACGFVNIAAEPIFLKTKSVIDVNDQGPHLKASSPANFVSGIEQTTTGAHTKDTLAILRVDAKSIVL